jgi:hypothetical protein
MSSYRNRNDIARLILLHTYQQDNGILNSLDLLVLEHQRENMKTANR